MNKKTKRLTFLGVMLALCAVLTFIPIPGFPTTSFDSLPGYLVAIYINPVLGGIITLLGHLLTAFIHGTPLGIPAHLIIALSMFVAAYAFGKVFNKNSVLLMVIAAVVAIALNIYSSMPFLAWFIGVPWSVLLGLQIPLLVASAANIILAILVFNIFKRTPHQF